MRPFRPACLLALALTVPTVNAAACREPKLESRSSEHPECLFYEGTRHFRLKEYPAALRAWQAIADMKNIPKEFEYLRVDAQNNLGYLYYMGWGVERDPERAIQQFWLPAERAGHEEAAYHLCHAYAEAEPLLALGYCREALRRYGKAGTAEDNATVIAQLRRYIARLEGR